MTEQRFVQLRALFEAALRQSVLGCACIHQARNIRMIERAKNLPFPLKPLENVFCREFGLYNLEGKLFSESTVGPGR